MMTRTLLIAFGAALMLACGGKKAKNLSGREAGEDFTIFLRRFNDDTLFQKTRVKYNFKQKVDLRISKIDTTQFKVQTTEGDSAVVTVTYKKNTAYWVKFVFKIDDRKWFLVNYLDSYRD